MKYIVRRIISSIPTILLVIAMIFVLTRVMPGDPARMYAGENAPEHIVEQTRIDMGLDKPYSEQFVNYVSGLLKGDFGYAWHTERPVTEDFALRFPASLELALFAMIIALIIGIPLGVFSARKKNSLLDHSSRLAALLGSSMPVFWLGLMLILLFYATWNIAPAPIGRLSSNMDAPKLISGMFVLDSLLTGNWPVFKDALAHILLPAFTLSLSTIAVLSRMTRSSMLEVLSQDYIRFARAKGLPENVVVNKHAFANTLIPVLTVIGSQFGHVLGYAVVTETIFAWPGIGSYVTNAILITDYAPVQAFALLSAIFFIVINLILDVLYTVVDPRVVF